MDFLSLLFFACALNGLLLSGFLFAKKYGSNKSNWFLGFFILIITGNLIEQFVTIAGYLIHVPHIMAAFVPFFFALGPLFYFYVKTLLNNEYAFEKWDWIHFLPVLIVFIFILPYYQLPGDYKYEQFISFDASIREEGVDFKLWFHLAFFIQCMAYAIVIIRTLNQTGIIEDRRISRKVVAAVRWLRRFTYIFLIFIVGYIITFTYITFQHLFLFEVFRVFNLLTSIFIYLIVYWSFRKSDLLNAVDYGLEGDKIEGLDLKQRIEDFFEKSFQI